MTAVDPFTTPAEAEREAGAKQAKDFLALAAGVQHVARGSYEKIAFNYADGVEAMRDAMVGQGYAMLAVRDELADIAGSLRLLAKMPAALTFLADHVSAAGQAVQDGLTEVGNEIHDLCATVDQGVEFADSTAAATASISVSMHDLTDAVLRLSEPRPRWWQWRRRRALQDAAPASPLDVAESAQEKDGEVHEFLVEVRRQEDPQATTPHEVLGRVRFHAEYHAACDTAGTMLPGLYAQLNVPTDPDQVYGRVSRLDPDGGDGRYVGVVFLPGATVLDAPAGGF